MPTSKPQYVKRKLYEGEYIMVDKQIIRWRAARRKAKAALKAANKEEEQKLLEADPR